MSMQLQPGKWYRQRDGGKAYVAAELPEELYGQSQKREFAFLGVDSDGDTTTWGADGRFTEERSQCRWDLITEWVDEPTDAEIAEAVRWLHENDLLLAHQGNGVFILEPRTNYLNGRVPTGRDFVDAVNEYRQREGA